MLKLTTTITFILIAGLLSFADIPMSDDVDFNTYDANNIGTADIETLTVDDLTTNAITAPEINGASSTVETIESVSGEENITVTSASESPSLAYPVITGVSAEFVDQQYTTISSYIKIGDSAGSDAQLKQTITPEQNKLSAISFYKYLNLL
jgi:hypothetical protein